MRRLARFLVLCVPLLSWTAASDEPQRVVAVGDIHGEYEGFVSILRKAGLVDEKLRWAGGRTTFVQTGDYVDRGPEVRKVMDLLMELERGAAKKRGQVVVLLGNHELMNLTAAFHEGDPASYAAFADGKSEKRRQAAYAKYVELHGRLAQRYGRAPWALLDEAAWNERHPLGLLEYQDAIGRDGRYGRWLRSRATAAKVGDTLFVHGGISPKAKERTIEAINERTRLEIEGFDRVREFLVAQKLILPFFTFP